MTNPRIRIGFIGLNPEKHWAATAHIPALKALSDEFEVVGVANSSLESSQAAARAGGNWAGETDADLAYLFDKSNGATMQAIPLAHTLAAVRDVLGDFGELSARFVSRFDTVKVIDTGETLPKTAPDQIMIHGTLTSGAAISIHYRGGASRGTNLLWEINGTEGDIQITGDIGHAQMTQLSIRGASRETKELEPLVPPASAYEGWPDTSVARNVARIYARLADDIHNGTHTAPTFGDAVSLHEIIDIIERSAEQL